MALTRRADAPPRAALRSTEILAESARLIFRHGSLMVLLAAVPLVLKLLAAAIMVGFDMHLLEVLQSRLGLGLGPFLPKLGSYARWFTLAEVSVLAITLSVLLVVAARLVAGQRLVVSAIVGRALRRLVPMLAVVALLAAMILGLSVGVTFLSSKGIIAMELPNQGFALMAIPWLLAVLWILATFLPAVPIAVAEDTGLRVFTRAAALTRHYRSQIAGIVSVLGIFVILLSSVHIALMVAADKGVTGSELALALTAMVLVLESALFAYAVAVMTVTHARLREVAEGGNPETLSAIFE